MVGCNIVAPALYIVHGPPKVQRVHELDSARPTVIFIDDRANALPRRSLRTVMARQAEELLIGRGVVAQENMLTSAAAMQVASQERYGDPRTVVEIGQDIGAEVVIYVSMVNYSLSRDGVSLAPTLRARVKVIDAAENRRIWPDPSVNGYPMTVELPARTGAEPSTRGELTVIQNELAQAAGVQLARLFYTHERDRLSGTLGD